MMRLPSDEQWAQVLELAERFRLVSPGERQARLHALRSQEHVDTLVLSMLAVQLALPLEPDRCRTGESVGSFRLQEPIASACS